MAVELWAEIVKLCMHPLRRGSWYRVVDAFDPSTVTLDVNGTPFVVDRDCVSLAPERPQAWSVVREGEANPYFGGMYGVCPNCVERANLEPGRPDLTCPSCGNTYPVRWPQG